MAAILNLAILDSAILVFPLKLNHTCQDWFPPFAQKKPSLIQSDSTWWWQPSWILPSWILPSWIQQFCTKLWLKLIQSDSLIHSDSTWWWQPSWILPCWIKKTSLIHSDSTWWWQSSWILPCWIQTLPSWIQTPSYLLSDSLKNTLTPLWLWLKLIQSDSTLFILTQLIDGSHLEFGHLGFSHLSFSSQTHSHLPGLVPTICTKSTSLPLPSPPFAQKILHSFILTQLDDGSHLEFYHVGFRHCHLGFSHFLIFSQIHSKTLSLHSDSDSN